jgi:catalase
MLPEDLYLREKITHFDHERIPERVVHARGAAAHGVFQVDEGLSDRTTTALLREPAKEAPVFVASRRWPARAARPTPTRRARFRRQALYG